MSDIVGMVLILFSLVQIKHMFADYFLQTRRMLSGRGEYLHLGRAQHAGVHAVGSAIVFGLIGAPPGFIAVLVVLEWIAHFHIDWIKARYCDSRDFDPFQAGFWRAAGLDQALHQFTYIGMVWAWVRYAAM